MRDVDSNVEIRNLVLRLLISISYSLRMRAIQIDEIGGRVEGLFADHLEESFCVGRVIWEAGSNFGTIDVVG